MKIVLITGPSGSGKSTLADLLSNNLSNALILRTDNYYKTGLISKLFSKYLKSYFDKSISLNIKLLEKDIKSILENKKASHIYKYDFIKKKRFKIYKEINKINYLIIEGIFALEIIELIENYNYLLVKIKTNKNLCRKRVLKRDNEERGKNTIQSFKNFNCAWNNYKLKEKIFKLKKFKNLFVLKTDSDINKILKIISTNI